MKESVAFILINRHLVPFVGSPNSYSEIYAVYACNNFCNKLYAVQNYSCVDQLCLYWC